MRHMRVILCLLAGLSSTTRAQSHEHGPAVPADQRLGTVHFVTSCAPATTPTFDRAVALLHSFEFGAAIRAFNQVLGADSGCAMAHWGIAMSRWTNPMAIDNRSPAQLRSGREAVDAARRLASRASDRERAYIDAVARLYDNADKLDQHTRVHAYSAAMAALANREPADTEARIFYAISLTAAASPTDKTYADQLTAGQILESIWALQPNHPGLAHYIIHSYDVPALAPRAEAAARRYAEIAPAAAHAQHMPSHIFTRVGQWQASIDANRNSIATAAKTGAVGEELHAADYLMYAYLQLGMDSAANALLATLPELAAHFDPNAITGAAPGSAGVFALAAIPARYALERRVWSEAAVLAPSTTAFPWCDAMDYFARALGEIHLGSLDRARQSIDSLVAIRQRLTAANEKYWAEQVAIEQLSADAWLALANGDTTRALSLMREAATREDATEKSAVTPGPLAPARELLGDMLLDLGRPREALVEYRATLVREPNRRRSLDGLARATAAQ